MHEISLTKVSSARVKKEDLNDTIFTRVSFLNFLLLVYIDNPQAKPFPAALKTKQKRQS